MKPLPLILLALFVVTTPAWASLHLVSRETFQGVGTLTSSAPGNLGTVTGTFYKRAVGPKITGDTTASGLGWSADFHSSSLVTSTLPVTVSGSAVPPPDDIQCFDCWIYVSNYSLSGTNDIRFANLLRQGQSSPVVSVSLGQQSGSISLESFANGPRTSVNLKLHTWYEVRLAWNLHVGGYFSYDVSVLYREAGAASFTTLCDYSSLILYTPLVSVVSGSFTYDYYSRLNGRFGMPSLYTLDSFSDRTALVSDVVDPSAGPFNWYVNPVSGNDNNDGTTASSAWKTVAKINAESLNCGMFPSTGGYATGDTLNISGATGPGTGLFLGPAFLDINTQGLNLIGHDTPYSYIQAEEIMTEAWTLVSGSSTIWQCTLSTVDPSSLMWEDDKWLNHPMGTTFAGAVATAMAAMKGSYWTDGTTMYYRPFVDSNPNTDGKVKTRSYNRGGVGDSAIQIWAPQVHISGIKCQKTALAVMDSNDPVNAYCLQSQGTLNGASLIEHCYFDYGSKHILGFTDNSTSRSFIVRDVTVDQCQPYFAGTPLVDYCSLTGPLSNTTTYTRVSNPHVLGLIGSTTGDPNNSINATWYSHSGGPGVYSNITMNNCQFAGYVESTSAESSMTLSQTTCGAIVASLAGSGTTTVDRCKTTVSGINNDNATCNTVVTNSIIAPTLLPYNGGSEFQLLGNMVFKGCTFDFSGLVSSGPSAYYIRQGALNLTMQDCIVMLNPAYNGFGFLANAVNTDTFALDHNLYQTASNSGAVFCNYNDGTTTANRSLQQLVTLKIENNSIDQAPLLQSNYIPQTGSPAIIAGINLNPPVTTDYSGTAYAVRETIGAYEPNALVIASQPVPQAVVVGQSVVFSVQATAQSGVTYQWQKNGVDISGATGSTLSLSNIAVSDQALYSVKVTNTYGTLSSSAVGLLPVTSQPAGTNLVALGGAVSFTVTPAGTGTFTYQWTKNGTNIAGATTKTYSLSNIAQGDYASYAVTVTNNGKTYLAGPYTLSSPNASAPGMPLWTLILLGGLVFIAATMRLRVSPN